MSKPKTVNRDDGMTCNLVGGPKILQLIRPTLKNLGLWGRFQKERRRLPSDTSRPHGAAELELANRLLRRHCAACIRSFQSLYCHHRDIVVIRKKKGIMELRKKLEEAINLCSAENGSNTPDFVLAEYLTDCLAAFNKATKQREGWYGANMFPGENSDLAETVSPNDGGERP